MYTLDPSAARLGLKIRGGLLNILAADPEKEPLDELACSHWHLQSGDRM